jgi:transglutaminase-like putative cysteine protease
VKDQALETPLPLTAYLRCSEYIDFDHAGIQAFLSSIRRTARTEIETAHDLFSFVRDEIAHSADIRGRRVTRRASEVLEYREGLCYAKSHLLAALLRGAGIPAGICYQKLTWGDTPEDGHCLHALNTIYLSTEHRWIRVDARGNRPGIDAQFSLDEERLAYPIRPEHGEFDYRVNHAQPHPVVIEALERHDDCQVLLSPSGLPSDL